MTIYNGVSAAGVLCFLGFLWLLSRHRRKVSLRVVVWGVALQIVFALFVFLVPFGSRLFLILNDITMEVIESAFEGIRFLFGPLALSPGKAGSPGFILAFQALPSVIFFAALMELLYYMGIMERLIRLFAKVFVKVMGISGAESLCASAQIFLGIESNLTIRPYLKEMTPSELMVVLTTGMATIASSVLGFYVIILSGALPKVAGHLISASILLAPAAILASKVLFPETGSPRTLGKVVAVDYQKAANPIEAVINGAMTGVKMLVGIGALLIAFIGIVALFDSGLHYLGKLIGSAAGTTVDLSLNHLLGYIFYPFTVAMGVPLDDAPQIARIIGERIIMTEVKSYQDLSTLVQAGKIVHERSVFIATYALCGFAHIPSLAIFVGGTSSLVPERTKDIAVLGLWALLAANVACFITGAVAGIFYTGTGGILFRP
ncbi:MAG TPA: nucleoside transporter C-terminal domain-containing protein [Syntrophorhabdaceae bacterium]|nr:nucleoside transporter C-terminal domain-containing protein [Syntrophorhabdaceae bacterium]